MRIKSILTSPWTGWSVSIVLFGILLAITDVALIADTIRQAQWPWLLAGLLSVLVLTVFSALKWWLLMPRSRAAPQVFVRVNFVSLFVGIFLPGIVGVEAARIAGITSSSKDLPAAFASVLVDRLFGLMTLAMTVVTGGIVATTIVPLQITVACLLSLAVLLLGCGVLMSYRCRSVLQKILPVRVNAALHRLFECLDLYRTRKQVMLLSLVLSMIFQFGRVVMVYFLALSLSMDVSFFYLIVVVPVALFVQMLPISVYGIGIRESAMVAMLALAGVAPETAISLSVLLLAVQIVGSFPGGILLAMGYRLNPPAIGREINAKP